MSEATSSEGGAGNPSTDMETFRQDMREQDLEELVDELIEAFIGDAPGRYAALQAAVESGDADGIRSAAHAYKSAAATMRAVRLADLLQQTETAAHTGDVEKPAGLLQVLKSEHEAVLAQLRQA